MAHRVHLDYASNAPLRPESREAMITAAELANFDARRLYDEAIEVRYKIETCREKVASFFGCEPFEVIFTSSHSESLVMIAYGVIPTTDINFSKSAGIDFNKNVVGTPYDSEIIFQTWLRENIDIRILAGNENATLEISQLQNIVDENTLALTIPFAHPDTGTCQDIEQVVAATNEINPDCIVHLDARLGAGNVEINFAALGIGAMSIDPVTFGGPSGVGALILSRKYNLSPLLTGSTQERARRAGQENYVGIAGFASACEETSKNLEEIKNHNSTNKKFLLEKLRSSGAKILGDETSSSVSAATSLDHVVAAYFPGVAASAVVAEFNRLGINIHAGSSCGSEEFEPSRQLAPVTGSDELSESIFRISWGWATTQEDIEAFLTALKNLPFSK